MKKKLCTIMCVVMATVNLQIPVYATEIQNEEHIETEVENPIETLVSDQLNDIYEGEGFKVYFEVTDKWSGGYNALVKIENTSDSNIDNWGLSFDYTGEISNIWNASITSHDSNKYTVKNVGWNQDIAPGQTIEFGISGQEDYVGVPSDYSLAGAIHETDKEDYAVSYEVVADWRSGFTASVIITNNSDETIEDWVLEFDYARDIIEIWNAEIISHDGDHYVIKNKGYNGNITPQGNISFGFNGSDGSSDDEPTECLLRSYGDGINDDPIIIKDTIIKLDTYEYTVIDETEIISIDDEITYITGTLEGEDNVKEFIYELYDANETLIRTENVERNKNWRSDDFGLVIGYNNLKLKAVLKDETEVVESYDIINSCEANMDRLDVDMEDDDHDGIPNYYEDILGTNRNSDDSDADGLSDQIELFIGTDNLLWDTDGNGTSDGDEDFDKDGLTNVEEVRYVTSCLSSDTDGDGLSDYEEIFEYETDPLLWDTDEDKLSDSVDIKRGFDPVDPDTDDDGIIDGDEVGEQTYKKTIEEDRKPGVTSVAVSFDCAGDIEQEVVIISTYNIDLQSSDVVGLIGTPVDISTDLDFDAAQIVFTYDENELGDTDEDDLCLMWYDEENDLYILLEDSVLDKDNNTITYNTTHFSTYLIVDSQKWYDTWDLNARNNKIEIEQNYKSKTSKETGSIYKCYETGMTWNQAKAFCESIGGHLVTITSKREQYIVESLMNEEGTKNSYWIGAEQDNTGHYSKWITGESITYTNYKPGQPDNPDEKALMIYRNNNPYSGGPCFGYWNDIFKDGNCKGETFFGVQNFGFICEWNNIDLTDTDGDGLYDRYETEGMQLPNGQIKYSNPTCVDSFGSELTDYEHLGFPRRVTLTMNSEFKEVLIFHGKSAYGLSNEFIYVDGRVNWDGTINNERLDYITYPDEFYNQKYVNEVIPNAFDGSVKVKGEANAYNSYRYKLYEDYILATKYIVLKKTLIMLAEGIPSLNANCFMYYLNSGSIDNTRRYYVDISNLIYRPVGNSMNKFYREHKETIRIAADGILNNYNKEAYIAVSPKAKMWGGSMYADEFSVIQDINSVVNFNAFTTFNKSNAVATAYCTFNLENRNKGVYIKYYIIDYYDFDFQREIYELNTLGLACSYELFGQYTDFVGW